MEKVINFVGNHYALFLTITVLLIFALIGWVVDSKRNKNKVVEDDEIDETLLEHIEVSTDKSLLDVVGKTKINTVSNDEVEVSEPIENLPPQN